MEPEKTVLKGPASMAGQTLVAAALAALPVLLGAAAGVGLGAPGLAALLASAIGVGLAVVGVIAARRLSGSPVSSDPSPHQRALDKLSEELTSLASPTDVAGAIERTIHRLLPCDAVEVSFAPAASTTAGRD